MRVSNSMDFVLSLCYLSPFPFTTWGRQSPRSNYTPGKLCSIGCLFNLQKLSNTLQGKVSGLDEITGRETAINQILPYFF